MTAHRHNSLVKLVRNKIIGRQDDGFDDRFEFPSEAICSALLVLKIHEEAQEIANDLTNPEKYADVLQALYELAAINNISQRDIEEARRRKLAEKGGFGAGKVIIREPRQDRDDVAGQ